jgi:hypothetical protein
MVAPGPIPAASASPLAGRSSAENRFLRGAAAMPCTALPLTVIALTGSAGQMWWQAPQPMHIDSSKSGSGKPPATATIRTAPVGQCSAHAPHGVLSVMTMHLALTRAAVPICTSFLSAGGMGDRAPLGH